MGTRQHQKPQKNKKIQSKERPRLTNMDQRNISAEGLQNKAGNTSLRLKDHNSLEIVKGLVCIISI